MTRLVRRPLLPLALLTLGTLGLVTPASAASVHRAAVIVDTGSTVHRVVITFTEDSISGISALQRAGANPAILNYNGQGGAVCALFGVGHPATNASCLGDGSDPRYWAYFRAGPSGPFVYSRGGAGTSQVHDGDVEGWKFETGSTPPPFATVDQIAPPPPPAPLPPAPRAGSPGAPAATGVGATASGTGGQGATAGPGRPGLTPSAGAPGATAAGALSSGKGAVSATARGALPVTGGTSHKSGADGKNAKTSDALQAGAHGKGSSSGGPPASLWVLVALLVVIAGAVVFVRRRRAVPDGSLPGAGP